MTVVTPVHPFHNIIGHMPQCQQLQTLLSTQRVPHALLLSGPASVGKRTIARHLAAALIAGTENPDSIVQSQALRGAHPDVRLVFREEGKRDITAESIRDLCSAIRLRPYSAPCTVAIIDHAEEMNSAAANALLMTLEEPPAHAFFVLVSSQIHALPATIISRCHLLHFGMLSEKEVLTALELLVAGLSSPVDAAQLARLCDGTLANLSLDTLISPRTLQPDNTNAFLKHLQTLAEETSAANRLLAALCEPHDDGTTLAVGAELVERFDEPKRLWLLVRNFIHRQFRSDALHTAHWARLLQTCIESEQLVMSRGAHQNLQLSSILLQFPST